MGTTPSRFVAVVDSAGNAVNDELSMTNTIASVDDSAVLTGLDGKQSVHVFLSNTPGGGNQWVGRLAFEGSIDGSDWIGVPLFSLQEGEQSGAIVDEYSNEFGNAGFVGPLGPFTEFRVRPVAWTSGTGHVTINVSPSYFSLMDSAYFAGDDLTPAMSPAVLSVGYVHDGTTYKASPSPIGYPRLNLLRTPAVFKSATASTTGSSAAWTPASGKKFRLMRYMLTVTGNAAQASGGVMTIKLLDGAGDIGQDHAVFVPGTAGTGPALYTSGWIDLGNGILAGAANDVLNVNLSAALTAGVVNVLAVGTEE